MKRIPILLVSLILSACGGGGSATDPRVDSQAIGSLSAPIARAADPIAIAPVVQPALVPIDPCAVAKHQYGEVTYPIEYRGAFSIPTTTKKLVSTITRTVSFKDYYPSGLIPFSACTDRTLHARNLYVETLNRLQQLGVDHVWVYNYGNWDDFTKSVYSVATTDWAIPKSEMIFIVNEAKKRNIKIYLAWQFSSTDNKGKKLPLNGNVSVDIFRSAMTSFHDVILDQAKFAETIGISGIRADWDSFGFSNIRDFETEFYADVVTTILDIRKNFSGKVVYGGWGYDGLINAEVAEKIDLYQMGVATTLSEGQNANLSVDVVKQAFMNNKFLPLYALLREKKIRIDLPIEWQIAIQSKYDYFVNGWTEDGFCVDNCIQKTYRTDLSVQAIGVEAALEAVSEQTYFKNSGVNFSASYWHTDDTTPSSWGWDDNMKIDQYDFPNLSQSIRNKPAEGIVRQWFSR